MSELNLESLIGVTVKSAKINPDKNKIVLDTDKGTFYLEWSGGCCANCFIAHLNGADKLVGATIIAAGNSEWKTVKDKDCEVVESMGSKFKTNQGYVDIETRAEHNGYYSGYIEVSTKPFYKYDSKDYADLKDF